MITVSQQVTQVTVSQDGCLDVEVSVPSPVVIEVTTGLIGPPGPTGPSGSANVTGMAVQPVSALRAISRIGTGVEHTDVSSLNSLSKFEGVSINAAGVGFEVTIFKSGLLTDVSWNWTDGLPIFIGAGGVLTQTPSALIASQEVAIAVSPTSILLKPQPLFLME